MTTGNYTFLLDYLPYVNGDGMEHRNSTVIAGTRDLKDGASQMVGHGGARVLPFVNVKRVRPKSLEPFDYENPNMSGELVVCRGVHELLRSARAQAGGAAEHRAVYAVDGRRG